MSKVTMNVEDSNAQVNFFKSGDSSNAMTKFVNNGNNFLLKKYNNTSSAEEDVFEVNDDGQVTFFKNVSFQGGGGIINTTTTSIQDAQLEIGLLNSMNLEGPPNKSGTGPYDYQFTVSNPRNNFMIGENWTFVASTDVWTTSTPHGLFVGDIISFVSSGGGATGYSINTDYYVKTVPSTTSVTLSASSGGAVVDGSSDSSGNWTAEMLTTFSAGSYVYIQNIKDSTGTALTAFNAALDVTASTKTTFTVQISSDVTPDMTTYPPVASNIAALTDNTGLKILAHSGTTLYEGKLTYSTANSKQTLQLEKNAGAIEIGTNTPSTDNRIQIGDGSTTIDLQGTVQISGGTEISDIKVADGTTGQIVNKDGTANTLRVAVMPDATAQNDKIQILNTDGTGADAIQIKVDNGTLDIDAAILDMDLTSDSSINTTNANFDLKTTTSGDININSSDATTITAGSTLGITATSGTTTLNCSGQTLDVNAAILDMDLTSTSSINTTSANFDLKTTTSGDININSSDATTITAGSTLGITAGSTLGITATSGTTTLNCSGQTLDVDANTLNLDLTDSSTIKITSSEDGEDLTIQQVGANNSSIIVEAAGTGDDAIKLDASSAGGITMSVASGKVVGITGDVTATGTITSSSDERLKTNIVGLVNSLTKVNGLEGVNFNWKEGQTNELQTGFIAQQVQTIAPELVKSGTDGYLQVNYLGVIPLLVEAIKEQQKEIEELKGRL